MDYKAWSDEYFRDAAEIKKTLVKYENMLREGASKNLEQLNAKVFAYRNIYYDLYNTGKLLLDRANGVFNDAA